MTPPRRPRTGHRVRRGFAVAWPLVLAIVLAAAPAAGQTAGILTGTVTSDGAGTPIAGASVEFVHPDWTGATLSDGTGHYRLAGVPAGRGRLRVGHLGHEPMELELLVAPGRQIVVDLALAVRPVVLDPVRVDGGIAGASTDSLAAPADRVGRATIRVLEAAPGLAEIGLAEAAEGGAGDDPLDPGSILFVRGAASDMKLVHLDGAPVYAPFPLGGLLDPFAPDLLSRADIYLGGAPARYDGGLSYVMDLRTRGADAAGVRTSGTLDLLSGSVIAEAGVGERAGIVASLRGMHPLSSSRLLADRLPYDYGEGLLRADLAFGSAASLAVTGFANRETVWMTEAARGERTIEWGNQAGSIRLRGDLGSTRAEVTAASGWYDASLPFGPGQNSVADGTARRSRVAVDLSRGGGPMVARFGASLEDQAYRAVAESPAASAPSEVVEAGGRVVGGYGELAVQPHPRISLRGGGRVDRFSTTGEVTLAPRLSATWMVTDRAAVTVAAGQYHQFLRPPDEVLLTNVGTADLRLQRSLLVGGASHFTAAFEQDFDEGLGLGLEGFYKRFADLPSTGTRASNASGVDLWVRKAGTGITGWFGYSLAWVWSSDVEAGQSDFAGRHLLNTGLSLPIDGRTRVELRFAYGAGIPYAGIPLRTTIGELGTAPDFEQAPPLRLADRAGTESAPLLFTPDEPFVRIDASLSRRWTRGADGRPLELVPFLRVINGLGARDALFYFLDKSRGENEPTPLGALPVIPILGLEWKF